jgi:hypothetical protein
MSDLVVVSNVGSFKVCQEARGRTKGGPILGLDRFLTRRAPI